MPEVRIPEVEKYLRALGLLAELGFVVESRDPDVLVINKREIEILAAEDLLNEATLAQFGLRKTRTRN